MLREEQIVLYQTEEKLTWFKSPKNNRISNIASIKHCIRSNNIDSTWYRTIQVQLFLSMMVAQHAMIPITGHANQLTSYLIMNQLNTKIATATTQSISSDISPTQTNAYLKHVNDFNASYPLFVYKFKLFDFK